MKILFVRHGESESNAGGKTEFPHSINLTQKGIEQSHKLLERITIRPDLIVVTLHIRTVQTAAPLVEKYPDVPVGTWPLHEFTFLSPLLCRDTTTAERAPWVNGYWERCDADYVHGEGAESFNQFIGRVQLNMDKLLLLSNENIVVFTHGYVIRAVMMLTDGNTKDKSMRHYRDALLKHEVANTSVHEIVFPKQFINT